MFEAVLNRINIIFVCSLKAAWRGGDCNGGRRGNCGARFRPSAAVTAEHAPPVGGSSGGGGSGGGSCGSGGDSDGSGGGRGGSGGSGSGGKANHK